MLLQRRRSLAILISTIPLGAAGVVGPGIAAADVPATKAAYSEVELQARTNLLVNDAGYNLPPGSSFSNITPHINENAEVSFGVQYVADANPSTGRPGVWFGGHGEGEIVHVGESEWMILGDAALNDHGDIVFTLSPNGMGNSLYVASGS